MENQVTSRFIFCYGEIKQKEMAIPNGAALGEKNVMRDLL